MKLKNCFQLILLASLFSCASLSSAGEVNIVDVVFEKKRETWNVKTQLLHEDSGWDHYADAWRIVDESGNEIATRILHHPHVDEQPFTRNLSDVRIPRHIDIVYVEAHDSVHGWSKQRVRIDLTKKEGPRYSVRF